jgi:yeast amino acid transporter
MSEHSDPEKNLNIKEAGSSDSATSPVRLDYEDGPKQPWTRRFVDSFRRDPNARVTKTETSTVSRGRFDHKTAAENTANTGLVQKLQSRHMQMIAIGGSIGS